jgi:hypothetical protein
MGFPIVPKGRRGFDKGKQVNYWIHGRMIDHHLSWFPRKSETETLVMTEDSRMVETVGVM